VTTAAPTSQPETTEVPTTEAQTTTAPTTQPETTKVPTTEAVTTAAPTTQPETTEVPTTEAETTAAPTTQGINTFLTNLFSSLSTQPNLFSTLTDLELTNLSFLTFLPQKIVLSKIFYNSRSVSI
jgi:hypothetical protein